MTADERVITAVDVHSGEYTDGKDFSELADRSAATGVEIKEIYGDKAYFRKDILDKIEQLKAKGYIPVSASVYRIAEELFSYNKDSDQWFCFMGNHTVSRKSKSRISHGKEYHYYAYLFSREQCLHCVHREECMGKNKTKARQLKVPISALQKVIHRQENGGKTGCLCFANLILCAKFRRFFGRRCKAAASC